MLPRLKRSFRQWLVTVLLAAAGASLDAQTTTAPSFVVPLADRIAFVGSTTVQISVSPSGSQPFGYQWFKNGIPLASDDRIKGTTGQTLWFTAVQLSDDASYSCTVTNSAGSATTNAAHLIIKDFRVVTPPTNSTVAQGATATLSVVANATDPITYQWTKDYKPIPGATTSTLTIPNAKATDEGVYYVELKTSFTTTITLGALLTVQSAPVLTIQPSVSPISVVAGSIYALYPNVAGSTPFSYQWYKDGSAIAGATQATLLLQNLQPEDAATYRVAISNAYGSITPDIATLKVLAILISGAQTKVYDGTPLAITVTGTVPEGLPYTIKYAYGDGGPNYLTGPPVNSGQYTAEITVPANSTGYRGTRYVPLTITPAKLSVQFSNLQQTYDGKPHQVSYTTDPPNLILDLSYGYYAPPPVDAGTYVVTASNSKNFNYVPAQKMETTLVVAKADQTISFSPLASGAAVGSPIVIAASASSGLNPVVLSLISGNAALSGNTLTAADSGTITVRAAQSGDKNYNAATADFTFSVGKLNQSISFSALPSVLTSAKPISLSASANSGLPVTYSVVSGPATVAGNLLTLTGASGAVTVRASQAGNSVYNAAPSVDRSFTVTSVPPPVITTQPASQTVTIGDEVTFSIVASGSGPLTYEWFKDGLPLSFSLVPTYRFRPSQLAAAGTYSVVVFDGTASTLSSGAVLTVKPPTFPGQKPPVITRQPASVAATVGQSPRMIVEVDDTAPPYFQWKKNGTPIAGATFMSLDFSNVQPSDAGDYSVEVVNGAGSVSSQAATLTVSLTSPNGSPVIVTHPASFAVNAGQLAVLSVTATGTDPLAYQWYKEAVPLSGATSSTLSISKAQLSDYGRYFVVVSNSAGVVSSFTAILTVNAAVQPVIPPIITVQPVNTVVSSGSTASLSVTAEGTSPFSYQWYKDVVPITGATSSVLTITNAQNSDSGKYFVNVSNSAGVASSASANLTVNAPVVAPAITVQPVGVGILSGYAVTFSVTATGTGPLLYQWSKDSIPISGATSSTLNIPNVQPANAGSYTVSVRNSAGSALSQSANLTVASSAVPISPPTITAHPANTTVASGSFATFSVTATGVVPLSYQWIKDSFRLNGATASTLNLTNVQPADVGNYAVIVTNPGGSVTSRSATLSLQPPPAFAGAYFGDLDNRQGTWALYVRSNNTGLFMAYLTATKTGIAQNVVVNRDGSFTATITTSGERAGEPPRAAMVLTVSGQIGTAGQVSGQINGATFTGVADISSGAKSSVAGLYTASALGVVSTTTTYAVVGSSGRTTVITVAPTASDAATGAVDAKGQFTATTASGAQLDATLDAATSALSGKVASGGNVGTFAGLNDGVQSTSHLINLSVRSVAGAGDQTLTVGFVSAGAASKPMLVRAVGPTLTQFSVPGALPNPLLRLFGESGTLLAANSRWDSASSLSNVFRQLGAFDLQAASADSALYAILPAGASTAQVTSQTTLSGVVLLEVYDAEPATFSSRLVNLSARTRVGPGSETLTAGFVLSGNAPVTLLLRGIGPALKQFGLLDALPDPQLAVFDSSGRKVAENRDWGGAAALADAMIKTGAFSLPADSKDAAILVTLAPGAYTAEISGQNNTSGVSLVEVYEVR